MNNNISIFNTSKRIIKKLLAYIIASSIIFLNISSVYCVEAKASILDDLGLSYDDIRQIMAENGQILPDSATRLFVQNLGVTGFVLANRQDIESWLADKLRGYSSGGTSFGDENSTDAEVLDNAAKYLVNNVSKSGNAFTYNDNSRNVLNYVANAVKNDSGYIYVNSFRLTDSINTITDGYLYNAIRTWLNDHEYNLCVIQHLYNGNKYYLTGTNSDDIALIRGNSYNQADGKWYQGSYYSYNSWNPSPLGNYISTTYEYDSTTKEFVESEYIMNIERSLFNDNENMSMPLMSQYTEFSISKEKRIYKLFNTISDFRASTQGLSTYYYNSNWENFVSGSGNYTVDSSNSNNITYGDVTSYVNNYYGDNGTYPDPTQVQVYIDNNIVTPDPTPSPTPNPDDPGGGGGGSGGLGDILGTLGSLIGSLITGIGSFLAGILEGLVTALNSLLSLLGEAIGGIVENIPQVFNGFMEALLSWMPPEWIAIISASLLLMVIVGVIKLIKG